MAALKKEVWQYCLKQNADGLAALDIQVKNIREALADETKSSVGDKYETARAMLHLEQQNIALQQVKLIEQKALLENLDIKRPVGRVAEGALLLTDRGYLFLSAGLGKVRIDDQVVFTLSATAPLGKKLMGLTIGDIAEVNNIRYRILDLC